MQWVWVRNLHFSRFTHTKLYGFIPLYILKGLFIYHSPDLLNILFQIIELVKIYLFSGYWQYFLIYGVIKREIQNPLCENLLKTISIKFKIVQNDWKGIILLNIRGWCVFMCCIVIIIALSDMPTSSSIWINCVFLMRTSVHRGVIYIVTSVGSRQWGSSLGFGLEPLFLSMRPNSRWANPTLSPGRASGDLSYKEPWRSVIFVRVHVYHVKLWTFLSERHITCVS